MGSVSFLLVARTMGATSEDEGSTGDALDIVLYLFVLGPAVEWCLKSPRVNRGRPGSWRGVSLAVLLLALVAAGKMAWESGTREPNHFETLGVRVDAGTAEIKRAYKTESLKYHPDKTDDPAAPAIFMRMQRAYETLKDPSSRDAYNRFGGKSGDDESGGMTGAAMFYAIWLVLGYLLTMGRASEDARTWAFSGLLALAVVEYQTRVLKYDYLAMARTPRYSRHSADTPPTLRRHACERRPLCLCGVVVRAPGTARGGGGPCGRARAGRGSRARPHALRPARRCSRTRPCTRSSSCCTGSSRPFCTARG